MFSQISKIFLLISIFVSSIVSAQDVSAIIQYQGVINKKYVDSFLTEIKKQKEVPMSIKQNVVDMYKNAIPDDYILNIKNYQSYYYNVPFLNTDGEYNMGSTAGTNPYYTNNSTNSVIDINPYVGNVLMNPLDWDISSNIKKIGDYVCYQAVATEKLYSRKGYYYYRNVVAWFTPDIALNFGPKNYNGLPGLVLEIQTGKYTLTATSINLNPEESFEITPPKGFVISEEQSHQAIKTLEDDRKKE